jgi:hypothetical protein
MSVEALGSVGGFPSFKELLPGRAVGQPGEIATASVVINPEVAVDDGNKRFDADPLNAQDRVIPTRIVEFAGGEAMPGTVETTFDSIDPAGETYEFVATGEKIVLGGTPASTAVESPLGSVLSPVLSPSRTRTKRPGIVQRVTRALEKYRNEPKFGVREATLADIPDMVDIDMRSFSKVYENYGQDPEEQRAVLTEMFTNRYLLMGSKFMPVVTQRGEDGKDKVVGFMTSCPTSKDPADFVSWEDTTNNGKLDTLYDPNGKNVYVVTLSMDPDVKGQRGQNLLFVQQVGTMVREGLDLAFFESRVPGLRTWVNSQCKAEGRDISTLTEAEKGAYAERYYGLTRERNGKKVPYDPLLKVYAGFGCNFEKLLPDAYKDEPSMDFGVLCTFDNPTPKWTQKSKFMRNMIGGAIKAVTKSSYLSRKAFG